MPLNEADRSWIREQIQNALKRRGWGRFTGFIRDWSGTGAAVAILLLFVTQWMNYVEFKTTTNIRLTNIENSVAKVSASVTLQSPHAAADLPQTLKDSLTGADSKLGLKTVSALTNLAKQQNIKSDQTQIASVGGILTDSKALFKKDNADAWNALSGLLGYYTKLQPTPLTAEKAFPTTTPHYDFGGTYGAVESIHLDFVGGLVPIDQAAIGEHIDNPQRDQGLLVAPREVVATGTKDEALELDGHHLRNVTLVNLTIDYRGGPVILENVSFVNCVFRFVPAPGCLSFSQSLFASNPVNFDTLSQKQPS